MGDNSYSQMTLSRFPKADSEAMSRPSTKLMAPSRRPGGPREASRPFFHSRAQLSADAHEPAHHRPDTPGDDDATSCTNSAEMAEIIEVETSCMDTLDHELITSPINCFMEICWAEAIQNDQESDHEDSPTLYNELLQGGHKHTTNSPHDREDNSDDLDPMDNREEKWERAHVKTDFKPADIEPNDDGEPTDRYPPRPVYSPTELPPYSSPPRIRSQTPQASLAFWEPHFTTRDPNDTVHGFPSRPAYNTKSRRWKRIDIIASARAHLSGRFTR